MYVEYISIAADISTIVGVISALWIYRSWKRDFRVQKAHEYSLDLLKKIKYLHVEIESIRSPKFYNPKTISEDIEQYYIPQIEEKIFKKIVEINVDLLIAEKSLIKHKEMQSKFNRNILETIMSPIRISIIEFFSEKNQPNFEIKNTELWEIIFPAENRRRKHKVKRSVLGTNMEVIDDEFNQKIENAFNSIYSDLEDNLATSDGKKKKVNMCWLVRFNLSRER